MKRIEIPEAPQVNHELAGALDNVGFPYKDEDHWPTLDEAQRWLRVALGLELEIQGCKPYYTVFVHGKHGDWIYKHTQKENNRTTFETYEDAQTAGMLTLFDLF